jgi:hypothetical protein
MAAFFLCSRALRGAEIYQKLEICGESTRCMDFLEYFNKNCGELRR